MKVGFAGLGNMGGGMARNVLAAGFELHVYNRTREKAEALDGAVIEPSASALAQKADMILTCLADIDVTRDVFLREDGLLAGASEGKIFVDH
ncbi:MAG: NAD(P)-binding domain-containing protein, partial [Planctomycetota bacterium]|nr:NAD(P)-binding domain-containing protein [Planctomycetota bacterium]